MKSTVNISDDGKEDAIIIVLNNNVQQCQLPIADIGRKIESEENAGQEPGKKWNALGGITINATADADTTPSTVQSDIGRTKSIAPPSGNRTAVTPFTVGKTILGQMPAIKSVDGKNSSRNGSGSAISHLPSACSE